MVERKLQSELRKLHQDPPPGVTASLVGDDIFHWKAIVTGPEDTPFENGLFRLEMRFPEDYPQRAPKVTFFSSMFHPNVYLNGRICLDILEDQNKWSPSFDAASVLFGIQAMLGDPNPDSPANMEANLLYRDNPQEYEAKVRDIVRLSMNEGEDEQVNHNLIIQEEHDQLEKILNDMAIEEIQNSNDIYY